MEEEINPVEQIVRNRATEGETDAAKRERQINDARALK